MEELSLATKLKKMEWSELQPLAYAIMHRLRTGALPDDCVVFDWENEYFSGFDKLARRGHILEAIQNELISRLTTSSMRM